jgi:hypothetical protein
LRWHRWSQQSDGTAKRGELLQYGVLHFKKNSPPVIFIFGPLTAILGHYYGAKAGIHVNISHSNSMPVRLVRQLFSRVYAPGRVLWDSEEVYNLVCLWQLWWLGTSALTRRALDYALPPKQTKTGD